MGRRTQGFLLGERSGGSQLITVSPDGQFTGDQFLGDGLDLRSDGACGTAVMKIAVVSGPGAYPSAG